MASTKKTYSSARAVGRANRSSRTAQTTGGGRRIAEGMSVEIKTPRTVDKNGKQIWVRGRVSSVGPGTTALVSGIRGLGGVNTLPVVINSREWRTR